MSLSSRIASVRAALTRTMVPGVVGLLAIALVMAVLTVAPVAVQGHPQAVSAERALFDAANRERVAQGLSPLRWDEALATAAREHSLRMAQRNTLSHQLPGEPALQDRARQAGARYSVIAENVAEGPTPEAIHSGWMHSAPHRANLLDPSLTAVGIAVAAATDRNMGTDRNIAEVATGGGMLFAVEDFSQSVANLNYEQQERQVGALLVKRGLSLSNANDDARKTCEADRGLAGIRASLVVRYEAPDLSRLPDHLEQKIQSGHYRGAAVGACAAGGSTGFTRFRVAVLLF